MADVTGDWGCLLPLRPVSPNPEALSHSEQELHRLLLQQDWAYAGLPRYWSVSQPGLTLLQLQAACAEGSLAEKKAHNQPELDSLKQLPLAHIQVYPGFRMHWQFMNPGTWEH
jgi:hypothetical protein